MDSNISSSPVSPPNCVKQCGYLGSSSTLNMCSSCYKKYLMEQENGTKTSIDDWSPLLRAKGSSPTVNVYSESIREYLIIQRSIALKATPKTNIMAIKNRCESCNKKVGLLGFKCRCEKTFCGLHRYPQEHSCSFDFKKVDQEILIRQNPLIKGDKLKWRI
ncbi:hypothetical protein ACFE04_007409 [Oxalis oulophora]